MPTAPLPTARPRSASRSWCALATAVLGLGALAGCGFTADVGQGAAAPATSRATDPAGAEPDPSSTSPAGGVGAQNDSDLPAVTLQGLGGLRYGMTPDQASQALGIALVGNGAYDAMRANSECGYLVPADGTLPDGINVMVTGPGEGTVTRVDVIGGFGGDYRTGEGIGIGDDVAAVKALQPKGITTEPGPYGDGQQVVTVNSLDGTSTAQVFYADSEGTIVSFSAGQQPQIDAFGGCLQPAS